MRILRINDTDIDIDDKTAIGITFQAYDIKKPSNRKLKFSNSFTLPATAKNLQFFGYANNSQTTSTNIYNEMTINYWIDNYHLVDNAKVRIDEISDRIKLYIVQAKTFWEEMKDFKWRDFLTEYEDWLILQGEYFLGNLEDSNFFNGSLSSFFGNYASGSRLIIPMYFGNHYNYNPGSGFLENETKITMDYDGSNGGHVCTYIKSVFEFIEYKYEVDFKLSDPDTSLLWNDTFAPLVYVPVRDYQWTSGGTNLYAWHIRYGNNFKPHEVDEHPDKTLYDLVNAYLQLFNVIIDEEFIDGVQTISLYRFDDIKTKAEVKNFSGRFDLDKIKFKPSVDGYKQTNRIKYAEHYPGAIDDNEGAKVITCLNKNLDKVAELFTIDAYYPNAFSASYGQTIINLSAEESFSSFKFLISNGTTNQLIDIYSDSTTSTHQLITSISLELAALYAISGEYTFIDEIIEYPRYYEVEKWLTLPDVLNIKFFKQYYIQELGGSFFINKISGFNPEKSNRPTKIELIRISDKVPKPVDKYLESFYVDGVGNAFVDGNGNYFI